MGVFLAVHHWMECMAADLEWIFSVRILKKTPCNNRAQHMNSHMWHAIYIPCTMATSRKPNYITLVLRGKSIHILAVWALAPWSSIGRMLYWLWYSHWKINRHRFQMREVNKNLGMPKRSLFHIFMCLFSVFFFFFNSGRDWF